MGEVSQPRRRIFGLNITEGDTGEIARHVVGVRPTRVELMVTPNIDHIVNLRRNPAFARAYRRAAIVVCDGFPVRYYAALCGIAGYFHMFPGSDIFAPSGRALGAFKDPNVYGPFLIWPALFLLQRLLAKRISILDLIPLGIILFGLLLSFSRGAWFHFTVSALVTIVLTFLTAPSTRGRMRVLTLTVLAVGALAALIVLGAKYRSSRSSAL